MTNEFMNADVMMNELMNALQFLRQNFLVTVDAAHQKLNAHQVSYLAASVGDSRGVHHVSGDGCRRLSAIMDSGSAECVAPESIAKSVP